MNGDREKNQVQKREDEERNFQEKRATTKKMNQTQKGLHFGKAAVRWLRNEGSIQGSRTAVLDWSTGEDKFSDTEKVDSSTSLSDIACEFFDSRIACSPFNLCSLFKTRPEK